LIEEMVMTPLRQRMIDALVLRGMALRTQESYIDAVARLARHYKRSPDALSAEQVQHFLLHLLRDRQRSRSTVNQYGCAYRFLYGTVLGLDGQEFHIPLGIAPQRLPEIHSREEITRLFAATTRLGPRTFLMLAYATGLRLSELRHLRVDDIDSHADRMCIRVEQGKGGKDRYVPLEPDVLELLRAGGAAATRSGGSSQARGRACSRSTTRPPRSGTRQRARGPASPSAGAYTHCATAMRPTCWKPVWTCTACRSGWATATSAPPCAICIWPAPKRPMVRGACRWHC
jgi:integrase/recombinase XerD